MSAVQATIDPATIYGKDRAAAEEALRQRVAAEKAQENTEHGQQPPPSQGGELVVRSRAAHAV